MMLLKDRVAVVTGGTRGIGYAIVKKYLENGAKVVLFGSKEESVNKAVQSLKAENPDWVVEGMWPNLTDSEEMEQAIAKVGEKYGRLDILVNNAGVSQSTKLEDYQPEDFAGIMNLNVNALFNAIQPAVKIMRAQGGGVILNTSSMVSISGQPSGVGYPTSKFAVNGMTLSLPENMIKPLIATIPLRRVGEPEDVANAFLFLASDMASYITGEILSVDGAARS